MKVDDGVIVLHVLVQHQLQKTEEIKEKLQTAKKLEIDLSNVSEEHLEELEELLTKNGVNMAVIEMKCGSLCCVEVPAISKEKFKGKQFFDVF